MGETTVISLSKTKNKSSCRNKSSGRGTSRAEQKRRVLTADEVRRLPRDEQIILLEGENPVLAKCMKYYDDPAFKDLVPNQQDMFETIRQLPSQKPTINDNGAIESKLRKVIMSHLEGTLDILDEEEISSENTEEESKETRGH